MSVQRAAAAVAVAAAMATGTAASAATIGSKCTSAQFGSVQGATTRSAQVCAQVGDGRYQWVGIDVAKMRAALGGSAAAPATTKAAAPAAGAKTSKDKPGAIGTVYVLKDTDNGNIDLAAQSVDMNAWPEIKAENQFNDAPPAGSRYVMVRVSATYHAGKKQKSLTGLLGTISLSLFGRSGVEMQSTDCSVVVPDQLDSFRELLDGGTLVGNLCFRVTESDAAGPLLFRADESFCFSNCDEVWVRLQ